MTQRRAWTAGVLLTLVAAAGAARGEPYLALRNGVACSACHLNVTGGGGRTVFGAGVGRQNLPWTRLDEAKSLWDGAIGERVRVGTDLRAAYVGNLRDGGPYLGEYVLAGATLYLGLELLPDRLLVYADEQLAGGATNREMFALYRTGIAGLYAKAGRFFQPYGWRLQDSEVPVRRATGFNFDESDVGVEVGAEPGHWTLAAAVTNGTSGGAERDNDKQVTGSAAYVRRSWRAGLSAANNDLPDGSTALAGLFGGFRAGPLVALFEADWIRQTLAGDETRGQATHAEIDWTPRRGLTLRGWAGEHDPDRDSSGPTQRQFGLGADWTALPGLQLRGWYRLREGPDDVAGARDDEAAIEVHAYF